MKRAEKLEQKQLEADIAEPQREAASSKRSSITRR
jgi:hypothetical protein